MKPKVVAFTAFVVLPIASFATFFLVDAVAGTNQPPAAEIVATAPVAAPSNSSSCAAQGGDQGACSPSAASCASTHLAQPVAKLVNGACPYLSEKPASVASTPAGACPGAAAKTESSATVCCVEQVNVSSPVVAAAAAR